VQMEEKNEIDNFERKVKIRKNIILIIIGIFVISSILIFSLYIAKEDFRKWIDASILKKNVYTENLPTIDLDINKTNQICTYGKYIAILNDKKVDIYNNGGESISKIPVDINNAIFDSSGKYLAIAEEGGKNFYLIFDNNYLWSNYLDGEIKQICVNENGYLVIVTADSTYKSIITLYNAEGKEVLKKYLSSTRAIDVSISRDNNFLAIAELDTSGTVIQSNVEVISISKITKSDENSIVYSYKDESGRLITDIEYQEKNNLAIMYDNLIKVLNSNFELSEDVTLEDGNITYSSVDLNSGYVYVEEESSGIFSSRSIIHINNSQKNIYNLEEVAKEVYTYGKVVAVNVGLETYFLSDNGWLIKKVTSNQEITNISFSNNLAVIIYKDRVEIVNL